MNCRYARENFSGYIEQELSEAERRDIAAHLARCAKCTSELFAMQKAMSLVRWVPRHEGSPGFEERLMRRIAAEERQPARPEWWRGALSTLAARWDDLVAAMMVPAPVGALLVALLLGGGGGAYLVKSMNEPQSSAPASTAQAPGEGSQSSVSALVAAGTAAPERDVAMKPAAEVATPPARATETPARVAESPSRLTESSSRTGEPATEVASAESKPAPAARSTRNRPPRTQLVGTGAAAGRPADVADWRAGGQPIEGIPEGPPAVSEVEYILHLIDANGQLIELPASAIVSGGTVTF